MKVESIVFTNSLPEVKQDGEKILVDFGVVVMELSLVEAVSLVINLVQVGRVKKEVGLSLIEKR